MQDIATLLHRPFRIIDISQPVGSKSACFPGDTPFGRQVTVSYEDSKVINLTSFTMSPHVGTHIDAPAHIQGSMSSSIGMVGDLPLPSLIGPVEVIDISPCHGAIMPEQVEKKITGNPSRLLIRTCYRLRYQVFESDYAYFSVELVDWLKRKNICLAGLDTPSVDQTSSKTLAAHHQLLANNIYWLENLDLTDAPPGEYFLFAPPIKFTELEASPVRAVLIDWLIDQ